jgi:hypothetical protein
MSLSPRSVLKLGLETMRRSARVMEELTPIEEARASWRELQNKLEAFICFSYPDQFCGPGLDPYRRLWTTEGIGYMRAECAVRERRPEEALLPLHTGMGLAFACRAMKAPAPVADRICIFLELCDKYALRDYHGACYEALGLVARNLHPESVSQCEQNLDGRLREYFWHGVGRGIYFIPTNLLPQMSAPWRSAQMAASEPSDEIGRLNAIAGLVWAVTLLNIRNPEILELFQRHHGARLPEAAYRDGARCAMRVWQHATLGAAVGEGASPGEWFRFGNDHYGCAKY